MKGSRMTTVARVCSVDWCDRSVLARGWCSTHYKRWTDGADLERPFRVAVLKTGQCRVPSCGLPDDHRNMCRKHYSRMMKYGLSIERAVELFSITSCQICGTSNHPLVIDHDHSCCPQKSESCGACVRGVICARCNSGLGYFFENPQSLLSAISYLSVDSP